MRIDQRKRRRRNLVPGQYFLQFAALDHLRHHETRRLDNAVAEHAGGNVDGAVVHRQSPFERYLDHLAIHFVFERKDLAAARRDVVDGAMPLEFFQRGRYAMLGEIGRRRAGGDTRVADAPCDEARLFQRTHTDHAIDAVLNQIDIAVREAQSNVDLGILPVEIAERRQQQRLRQRPGGVDANGARRALPLVRQRRLRIRYLRENADATFVVQRTIFGDTDLPGGAVQQPHTDVFLERLDQVADRSARQIEQLSCL
jgi:hypothetical protein